MMYNHTHTFTYNQMESPMKHFVLVLALFWACASTLEAQQPGKGVAVEFKQLTVAFHGDPKQADARLLPLVDASLASGTKERFGLGFGTTAAGEKVFEILDKGGVVLKSVSTAELLGGKGSSSFSAGRWDATSRRMERISSVELPNGRVQIVVRALATGDGTAGSVDQHLVVTFGLKADAPITLALRVSLSALGNVEPGNNGFVLTPKAGSAALSAAFYPAAARVSAGKGKVVMTSTPIVLDGASESPAFWLVLDGVTSSAPAGAKSAALLTLKEKRISASDAHVVVVSATDKQSSQPGDTVTYMVVCANIGPAGASNVTLSNPIPDGTQYLDGSATSEGCVVSLDRSATKVKKISWAFPKPVEPGGERVVSFKVRVR
jgi:large repetitive protein